MSGHNPPMKRWEPEFYTVPTEDGGELTLTKTQPEDPAYALLQDDFTSTPTVYRDNCYICRDPEFAQMGMSLCYFCPSCKRGHIAADDCVCDDCGYDAQEAYYAEQDQEISECEVNGGHYWMSVIAADLGPRFGGYKRYPSSLDYIKCADCPKVKVLY